MLRMAYPTRLTDVGAQFVGDGQWRLVNKTVDSTDPAGVLGFVQKVPGGYEVLPLDRPTDPTRVATLRDARALCVEPDGD